jgi:hypothetical protein
VSDEPNLVQHLDECQSCRSFVSDHQARAGDGAGVIATGGFAAAPGTPGGQNESLPDHLAHCDDCTEHVEQHRDSVASGEATLLPG